MYLSYEPQELRDLIFCQVRIYYVYEFLVFKNVLIVMFNFYVILMILIDLSTSNNGSSICG